MPNDEVTRLIAAAGEADTDAGERLLPVVYDELRRGAQKQLAGERPDHTLSATALVHEAYLKLVGPREVPWSGRAHFYAAAAQAMRRILVDHARAREARQGSKVRLEDIGDVGTLATADSSRILAVDEALARLESNDPEAAAVVRLRFFAGLSVDDTARALGTSPRTTARLWAYARAVLFRDLTDDTQGP
ncbi:MAG: ECF-type sigma factor [Planctomycetota bacterium]